MARFDHGPARRLRASKGLPGSLSPHKKRAQQDASPPRRHAGQTMSETYASATAPAVSIVVPVRNEADNIAPLVDEIAAALDKNLAFELIYVNDGSTDRTQAELIRLMASRPWLRQIRHEISCGQSAAVSSGVIHARAAIVVTLDGDGQNDPAFIPALLEAMTKAPHIGLVAGQRVGRQATGFKKFQSRVANAVRSA